MTNEEKMMQMVGISADDLKAKNNDEKLSVLMDLISIDLYQSDKLGYDFEVIKVGDIDVRKTYVEQTDQKGTAENPIEWVDGMTPINNAFYLIDGVRYVHMDGQWVEF